MNAGMNSIEEREVARFGMFDREIVAEMEARVDDVPVCFAPTCDRVAEFVLVALCCKDKRLICGPCPIRATENFADEAAAVIVACDACGHTFPDRPTLRDVVRVVQL